MNYFSKNLKYLRKKKRESQKDLADYLGIGNTTVSNYELDVAIPDLKMIEAISIYYGVKESEFLYTDLSANEEMTINIKAAKNSNPNVQIGNQLNESVMSYTMNGVNIISKPATPEEMRLRERVSFLEGQVQLLREILGK